MDAVDRLLLAAGGFNLPNPSQPLSPAQWKQLAVRAHNHRLVPLAWSAVAKDPAVPSVVRESLRAHAMHSVVRTLLVEKQLLRLTEALHQAGIPSCSLKGVPLAVRLYGDALMRQSGDIDLLVQPKDMRLSITILECLGFVLEGGFDEAFDHHALMQAHFGGTNLYLELHSGLKVNKLPWFPKLWWGDRSSVNVQGHPVSIFRDDHLLVHLCHHAANHGFSAWGWLTDIDTLMKKAALPAARLATAARETGMERPVYYALRLISHLGGTTVDSTVLMMLRPTTDLWWLVKLLVCTNSGSSRAICRLVGAVTTANLVQGRTMDWFFPPFRVFRKNYPQLSPALACFLYLPWLIQGVFEAVAALIRTALSIRRP